MSEALREAIERGRREQKTPAEIDAAEAAYLEGTLRAQFAKLLPQTAAGPRSGTAFGAFKVGWRAALLGHPAQAVASSPLRETVQSHIADLVDCVPSLRRYGFDVTAAQFEKAIEELRAALAGSPDPSLPPPKG